MGIYCNRVHSSSYSFGVYATHLLLKFAKLCGIELSLIYFGCLGQSVTQSDQHQVMSSVGNLSASFISSPLKQRGKVMNFQAICWFYSNETLPLTSGQKFCLLSQATSFVTYACDFATAAHGCLATLPTKYRTVSTSFG